MTLAHVLSLRTSSSPFARDLTHDDARGRAETVSLRGARDATPGPRRDARTETRDGRDDGRRHVRAFRTPARPFMSRATVATETRVERSTMGCSTARASQRGRPARARAMGARDDASFMRWLGDATNDASLVDKIEIQERAKTFGTRGVAAVRDLAPGETLLRVPWRLVSESSADADADADGRDAWSTSMGMEILEELYGGNDDGRRTWLMRLPKPAPETPPLHFDDDELAAIEDDAAEAEAQRKVEAHERAVDGCSDRLEAIGKTREDLRWATAVVHSRVFTRRDTSCEAATRLVGAGRGHVQPRLRAIQLHRSSGDVARHVSGAQATDEIAPSMSTSTRDEEKHFELVADPDGRKTIEAGTQLLISYGSFPNDVWLLYFGFIPRDTNPNDTFALFPEGVDDLVRHACRRWISSKSQTNAFAPFANVSTTTVGVRSRVRSTPSTVPSSTPATPSSASRGWTSSRLAARLSYSRRPLLHENQRRRRHPPRRRRLLANETSRWSFVYERNPSS